MSLSLGTVEQIEQVTVKYSMRALWDYPTLPYRAVAPWPRVMTNNSWDWVQAVDVVEAWLEITIGSHYRDWTWSMWTLQNPYYCGVSFNQERSCTLFLLRFGSEELS